MTCRAADLATLLSILDGQNADFDFAEPCPNQAAYRTRITREDEGGGIFTSVRAELCDDHDRHARTDAGYGGSWVMPRHPASTP